MPFEYFDLPLFDKSDKYDNVVKQNKQNSFPAKLRNHWPFLTLADVPGGPPPPEPPDLE